MRVETSCVVRKKFQMVACLSRVQWSRIVDNIYKKGDYRELLGWAFDTVKDFILENI